MDYQHIIVEKKNRVGLITINRPEALNAMNEASVRELARALDEIEDDEHIGALVLTGDERAFAAGADIKEMQKKSFQDVYLADFITHDWERLATCRKPVVAAVAGYALGFGCEIAMMCDIILAAENAKFGQPEITIGIIPGAGGTQRLPRFVGKAKAMEMCLTGRLMDAAEAERAGLVSRIVPLDRLLAEALKTAETIAELSRPSVYMVKESIQSAFRTPLTEGLRFERRMFHATFATDDQKEGMSAFIEKRKPKFTNR